MARPPGDPDRRKERASQRRTQRRSEILAAARKVFSQKGYHACSIADILDEAGVARGTFYLYFPSKRAIFDTLLEEMFTQLRGAVRRVETGPGAPAAVDQVYRMVSGVIDVLETDRELTIILLREAVGLDSDFDQKLSAFYERLASLIEGGLLLGQAMGLVRPCDVRVASCCVLGSVKEVMLSVLTGQRIQSLPRPDLARELVDYSLRGLFVRQV